MNLTFLSHRPPYRNTTNSESTRPHRRVVQDQVNDSLRADKPTVGSHENRSELEDEE